MKLHTDTDAFAALLRLVSAQANIRVDVLEKDYYVTLLLKELSEKQDTLPAYFKGGTALYKALGSIRRFSEDIDLTVCIDGCSNSQAKLRLEKAANGYKSLSRTVTKELENNHKGSITSVYDYTSILGSLTLDPLQRFSHVKVEATSFTISEPFAPLTIAPLVYNKANDGQKSILYSQYGVEPFSINTIRLERIFIDKIFASEFYYQRSEYFDVAKHIYDLSIMLECAEIKKLLENPSELTAMTVFKRREEKARIGSDLSEKPISDFIFFEKIGGNRALRKKFMSMQDIYIFDERDKIDFEDIVASLLLIKTFLMKEQL